MNKILYYIGIPTTTFGVILLATFLLLTDFQKATTVTVAIIQGHAIIIGSLWAYRQFGWEKKCKNIIALKAALMGFASEHNMRAAEYRQNNSIVKYKAGLLPSYNKLQKKIHLSYYLPKKLRDKIFQITWLTIGNEHGNNLEKLDENWQNFEKQLKEIFEEFDSIISF